MIAVSETKDKDRINVEIIADSLEEVQGRIMSMEFDEGYSVLQFSLPKREQHTGSGAYRWVARGWVKK